jgi:hypothetical protein
LAAKEGLTWWLGATCQGAQSPFRWLSGARFAYADWYPGYPYPMDRETLLAAYREAQGVNNVLWVNYDASYRTAFICEWER